MTQRLSQTAVLTMLVACVGTNADAQSLESSALEAGRQFDLTAQLDKTAPVKGTSMDIRSSIVADAGLKLDQVSSSAGAEKLARQGKDVPSPSARRDAVNKKLATGLMIATVVLFLGGIAMGAIGDSMGILATTRPAIMMMGASAATGLTGIIMTAWYHLLKGKP